MESANQDVDGRPIQTRVEESGAVKYGKAFGNSTNSVVIERPAQMSIDLFRSWIEGNLEIYKARHTLVRIANFL